jgi:flagellar basal-body rod protein FlgB
MSIFDPTQITLMRAISGATLRNTVLSNNIANADTPGFQPSDVDFHATLSDAMDEGPEAARRSNSAPNSSRPAPSGPTATASTAKPKRRNWPKTGSN